MRRIALAALAVLLVATVSLLIPNVRHQVRAIVRPDPPAPITPLALGSLPALPSVTPRSLTPMTTLRPTSQAPTATAVTQPAMIILPTLVSPTPSPLPSPTKGPVVINGRVYEVYIPTATKKKQAYQYSCEFDAAWVIFQTYGFDVSVDDLIGAIKIDPSIEPYFEETSQGFVIHGGDIATSYSGDYTKNFLARSTNAAMRPVFEKYGLRTTPVSDRAGVEAALRAGSLVWIKTTVDFKSWRPAIWKTHDGHMYKTVLGNDHAVVVMGFSADTVVIRDVLGPTSTNRQRPYEYEVDWGTFLASWGAQSFDGLAVAPPSSKP